MGDTDVFYNRLQIKLELIKEVRALVEFGAELDDNGDTATHRKIGFNEKKDGHTVVCYRGKTDSNSLCFWLAPDDQKNLTYSLDKEKKSIFALYSDLADRVGSGFGFQVI